MRKTSFLKIFYVQMVFSLLFPQISNAADAPEILFDNAGSSSSEDPLKNRFIFSKHKSLEPIISNGKSNLYTEDMHTLEEAPTIFLEPVEEEDSFIVEDFDDSMAFVGCGVATKKSGLGSGQLALFEGQCHVIRNVRGLQNAQMLEHLSIPKKAQDLISLNIGDKISYMFASMPTYEQDRKKPKSLSSIKKNYLQVIIEKQSDSFFLITFIPTRPIEIMTDVGTWLVATFISDSRLDKKNKAYGIDISSKKGKALFRKIMRYNHLFSSKIDKQKECFLKDESNLFSDDIQDFNRDKTYFYSCLPSLTVQGIFSFASDGVEHPDYSMMVNRLIKYIDLREFSPEINWLNDGEDNQSIIARMSISLEHEAVLDLIANRRHLVDYVKNNRLNGVLDYIDSEQIKYEISELKKHLAKIESYYKRNPENSKIRDKIRQIMRLVRKNYHLLMAIQMVIPDQLHIDLKLQGTNFRPIEYRVRLKQ